MRDWDKLLSGDRLRKTTKNPNDGRSEFERDYDRIVYCSAFRRLQDKAQVFPLERGDFVRTRLTHSLEVASLARSMGVDIARKLEKKKVLSGGYDQHFGSILSSVSLIHDIGNPPFGHSGERAISKWFRDNVNAFDLSEHQKKEFTGFEGNAQGFRIVTKLQYLFDEYGLNLTYGTLASLLKYPRAVDEIDKDKGASFKKYGYFQSESERFEIVSQQTGLNGYRHPLAFLLEAADDIAYSAADIEDGVKKGSLHFDELIDILDEKLTLDADRKIIDGMKRSLMDSKKGRLPEPCISALHKFRIDAQARLLRDAIDVFVENYDKIMAGGFDDQIIAVSDARFLHRTLKDIGVEHIYCDKTVLAQELLGEKVIADLLDVLTPVATDMAKGKRNTLTKLISPNFRHVFHEWAGVEDEYNALRVITDFISGMTDSFALNLYKEFNGIKI